jgi:hypothetical protein
MNMNVKYLKDKGWSIAVGYLAKNACELCGAEGCDAHHVIKRSYLKTKYDVENGIFFCRNCHNWAEEHSKKLKEWFILTRGKEVYKQLFDKAKKIR